MQKGHIRNITLKKSLEERLLDKIQVLRRMFVCICVMCACLCVCACICVRAQVCVNNLQPPARSITYYLNWIYLVNQIKISVLHLFVDFFQKRLLVKIEIQNTCEGLADVESFKELCLA